MGFRSTLTTEYFGNTLPDWFKEKYQENYFINGTLVASKCELSHDGDTFIIDYQKALNEINWFHKLRSICVVIMGEDKFITKVRISKDTIKYFWLREEEETDHIWNQG